MEDREERRLEKRDKAIGRKQTRAFPAGEGDASRKNARIKDFSCQGKKAHFNRRKKRRCRTSLKKDLWSRGQHFKDEKEAPRQIWKGEEREQVRKKKGRIFEILWTKGFLPRNTEVARKVT